MPATISAWTTFAPDTSRDLNTRSGRSGRGCVASRATKPTNSSSRRRRQACVTRSSRYRQLLRQSCRRRASADPLARLGKRGDDHSENQRRRHRAADTLDEPSGDQELLIARHTAQQRSCGENLQPRNKDAFGAKQVAEAAGEEQQATESNQVR